MTQLYKILLKPSGFYILDLETDDIIKKYDWPRNLDDELIDRLTTDSDINDDDVYTYEEIKGVAKLLFITIDPINVL